MTVLSNTGHALIVFNVLPLDRINALAAELDALAKALFDTSMGTAYERNIVDDAKVALNNLIEHFKLDATVHRNQS